MVYGIGQAADNQVAFPQLPQLFVRRLREGLGQVMFPDHFGQPLLSHAFEEFIEGKGVHIQKLNFPDGEGVRLQRHAQEGTGGAQSQLRHLLGEIFQAGERLGAALDLIEDDQIQAAVDGPVEVKLQFVEYAIRFQIPLEYPPQLFILFKIDIMVTWKSRSAEFLQDIGLADLPGAPENQGFAVYGRFQRFKKS